MRRLSFSVLLLSLGLPLLAFAAHSQSFPSAPPATRIALDHSVVALTGPWKFHIGAWPARILARMMGSSE
jgi:hypothetical protein